MVARLATVSFRPVAVVTGGAGFVGSHLSEQLLADGYQVACVDNFETGRIENIQHLLSNKHFSLFRHDMIEPLDLPYPRVAEVYNLASPASPPMYQRDPIHTLKTNVLGALNALEFARRKGARIFQASTSEVYGDPEVHPQPEGYWGTSTRSGRAPATTRASAPPRRRSSSIASSMASISASRGSSTPTGRA